MYTELWEEVLDGVFERWDGTRTVRGVSHPPNIGDLWSDEELAAVGLFRPVSPEVPAGKVVVGKHVERANGAVTFVYALEDLTDEQYPPLEPWQFWSIIDLSGIGEQALRDAIALIPDEAFKVKALRKLANPPGGKFLRSDPLFNNAFLMMQIEKTAEEINALWLAAAALE